MGKNYKIIHDYPEKGRDRGLILLPVGEYYNKKIQVAKEGDYITFLNGVKRQIIKICYIGLKQGAMDFLCHYIYGEPLSLVLNEWLLNATFEGHGRAAVSQERCLIIWYKKNGNTHRIKI